MKHLTSLAAVGAAMTLFAAASPAYADGWDRSRTVIGPDGGQYTAHGEGYCEDGHCSSQQQWTGPRGRTVTRQGSAECHDGYCRGRATYTGPNGGQAVVKRRFRRY
jgi:hypothetical protein